MKPFVPQRSSFRRASSRWFATGGIAAAIAATTLAACGPRDETPLAGGAAAVAPQNAPVPVATAPATTLSAPADPSRAGSPVPAVQAPAAALAPAPAYAPPPVTVAGAQAYPATPNGDATAPQYAPVPAANSTGYPQDGPPRVQPTPAAGPATPQAQAPVVPRNGVGAITAIEPVRQRPQGSGAGAVIGGVLGGVIGNQFGHGLGRAAMTGVGAAGGAIAGNNVERNYKTAVVGYRVHVRLDNGSTRTFERKNIGSLHVGDRVRLDANGFHRG